MDNWYNKRFITNPDNNYKSLNATVLAVLILRDAPRYWYVHLTLEEFQRRVLIVARMLVNTGKSFARILCDLGFAGKRPVVRNHRAPRHLIPEVPATRPHLGSLHLSKEKVGSNLSLLNRLQLSRDLAQHTCPVVPSFFGEKIHYGICRMMYGEKKADWSPTLHYTASGTHTKFFAMCIPGMLGAV